MKNLIAFVACLCACQPDQGDLDRIEASLKDDPTRGGKVGTLVALHVRQQAASHITDTRYPSADCALPSSPRLTKVTLSVSRSGATLQSWNESRWYDPSTGTLRVEYSFTDKGSQSGDRRLEWRLEDGHWLTKSDLDTDWFRRKAAPSDIQFLRENGVGVGQTLMNAVSGWAEHDGSLVPGANRMECEPDIPLETGWLDRFDGRVELRGARVDMSGPEQRTTTASWTLSDGTVLAAEVVEQSVQWEPETPRTVSAAISRNNIDERLDAWQKHGLIAKKAKDE